MQWVITGLKRGKTTQNYYFINIGFYKGVYKGAIIPGYELSVGIPQQQTKMSCKCNSVKAGQWKFELRVNVLYQ